MYNCNGPIVRRTVHVIDRDGKITYGQRSKPSVDDILAVLSTNTTAKYVQPTPNRDRQGAFLP